MASHPPHVLVLPFPAQGHVIPLMELSRRLASRGFRITFVNSDFNHDRIVNASSEPGTGSTGRSNIQLVSVPDGLAPGEDRNNFAHLCESMTRAMPGCLEQLIRKINGTEPEQRITWMVADQGMAWAFIVAKETGIRAAAFWPAASTVLATMMSLPKLIDEGILYDDALITPEIFLGRMENEHVSAKDNEQGRLAKIIEKTRREYREDSSSEKNPQRRKEEII